MAQDRADRAVLVVAQPRHPGQLRHRRGPGVLVRHRHQRHGQPGQRADQRTPDARAAYDHVRAELAGLGDHAGHRAAGLLDPGHPLAGHEPGPPFGRPAGLGLAGQHRPGQPVGRDVEAAQNPVRVDQRMQPRALLGRPQVARHPPGRGPAVPPGQVRPAGAGGGQLQAADRPVARLPAHRQVRVLAHRVAGELGHRLARVGLEHQAGRVPGRPAEPAAPGQRPLVEHGDVGPAPAGQLIGQRAADDAGPDHDDPGSRTHDRPPVAHNARCCFLRNTSPGRASRAQRYRQGPSWAVSSAAAPARSATISSARRRVSRNDGPDALIAATTSPRGSNTGTATACSPTSSCSKLVA